MNGFPLRLILVDLRSSGNVGSILRTADAAGVELVYACGYTPYPRIAIETRPPHVSSGNHRAIAKTALGAENSVVVKHFPDAIPALDEARSEGFKIIMLEQAESSLKLYQYHPPAAPLALVLGNEVDGIAPELLATADTVLELPMLGRKESLNVAVTAAVVMYQMRFMSR